MARGADVQRPNAHGVHPTYLAAAAGHTGSRAVLEAVVAVRRHARIGDLGPVVAAVVGPRRRPAAATAAAADDVDDRKGVAVVAEEGGRSAEPVEGTVLMSPYSHWGHLLPPAARAELRSWARAARRDARACFDALYAPTAAGTGGLEEAGAPRVEGQLLRAVVHDGTRHLQRLIASFLVYPRAATRRYLLEIDCDRGCAS